MFEQLRISVVIPSFDTAELTLRCCASAIDALPSDGEIIVVDDGSRDDTARRIEDAFPSIRVLRNETNRGFAAAANRGAGHASGDVILFLNSDTNVARGAVRALLAAFDAPALGIAGAQLFDPGGAPQWSGGPEPGLLWLLAASTGAGAKLRRRRGSLPLTDREVDWVSGAAMAVRREVWNTIGPFREDFAFYAQDLDLCIRARDAGWRIRIIAAAHIEHAGGATFGNDARAATVRNDDLLLWYAERRGAMRARFAKTLMRLLGVK